MPRPSPGPTVLALPDPSCSKKLAGLKCVPPRAHASPSDPGIHVALRLHRPLFLGQDPQAGTALRWDDEHKAFRSPAWGGAGIGVIPHPCSPHLTTLQDRVKDSRSLNWKLALRILKKVSWQRRACS